MLRPDARTRIHSAYLTSLKYRVVRNGVPVCRFLLYNSSGGVRLTAFGLSDFAEWTTVKNEPTPTTVGTCPETAIEGIMT